MVGGTNLIPSGAAMELVSSKLNGVYDSGSQTLLNSFHSTLK
jgi:hypothetical protein